MSRTKRLNKVVNYETGEVKVSVIATGQELVCNVSELNAEMCKKLVPLALSHRIGDAAAGKEGDEAFQAMTKVWEGLKAGNFTIRVAAVPGLKASDIKEKLAGLTGKDAAMAAALLEKLGIKL
jgi:hypothetical protein